MGIADKIEHGAEDASGKIKESAGAITGDDSEKAEGKADQGKADVKKAGDDLKDAFNK